MTDESKLIFEISREGRRCVAFSTSADAVEIPEGMLREKPARLPEVAEVDLVRHYIGLSKKAHGVDNGFYPLGSCTMKYNPRINEDAASMPGFKYVHPYQEENTIQGCLEMMYDLKTALCEITGMQDMTLQPAAGAHGEFTGMLMIKAYHESRGDHGRNVMLVPDSAHGTNPASAAMAGFEVRQVPSDLSGCVDLDALRGMIGADTAGLMLTNPNTLGLFEKNIEKIAEIVHNAGGLLYYDGANLNAVMGIVRPGDMGFDVIHLNLHKTFSTPHGGGGPGSGPVGCREKLVPFLPVPVVVKRDIGYSLDYGSKQSIGSVKNFYGNFSVLVKAYAYIMSLGAQGLTDVSKNAVLNANYMMSKLKGSFDAPHDRPCMHEFVLSAKSIKEKHGVGALDISKAMLDYGMHPPTMYFPLIVEEALMIEPTETESVESLDKACDIITKIVQKAAIDPESLHSAPHTTPITRLDEVAAARKPVVRYVFSEQSGE